MLLLFETSIVKALFQVHTISRDSFLGTHFSGRYIGLRNLLKIT
jgi:hypothetical protein